MKKRFSVFLFAAVGIITFSAALLSLRMMRSDHGRDVSVGIGSDGNFGSDAVSGNVDEGRLRHQVFQEDVDVKDPMREMRIPRVVHLTVPDRTMVSLNVRNAIRTWEMQNPGFEVILHDDQDMLQLVKEEAEHHFPGILQTYLNFKRNVERADLWRYLIIYLHGGIYADSDVNPLVPILEWTKRFDLDNPGPFAPLRSLDGEVVKFGPVLQGLIGAEVNLTEAEAVKQSFTFPLQICQWTFGFRKFHPFLRGLVWTILKIVEVEEGKVEGVVLERPLRSVGRNEGADWDGGIMWRTGPGIFTIAARVWIEVQSRVGGGLPLVEREEEGGGEDTPKKRLVRMLEGFARESFVVKGRKLDEGTPRLTSANVSDGYVVVGSVGFLPAFAFGNRAGTDPLPEDFGEVLVRHGFAGSWKGG
ncbi:membrane-bound alpha-1,6- mannosyltransferase Initiation-specific [Phlyctochytrium planicorne]|nr:membrane-bound alpha-1,6- mannosyltransferase Initiation-specific [Phlyctochytrium planicorne]